MKVFIMAILLGQIDLAGDVFYIRFQQDPIIEYATIEQCKEASVKQGNLMLENSLKYPELNIIDVKINCVESKLSKGDISKL
jgi:hypothetical protein